MNMSTLLLSIGHLHCRLLLCRWALNNTSDMTWNEVVATHLLLDTAANFELEVQFPFLILGTHALSCYFSVNNLTSVAYITWKCRKTNDTILLLLAKDALAILKKEEPDDVFSMYSLSDKIERGLFGLGHQDQD